MSETPSGDRQSGRRRRSDAEENIERIVRAATELLRVDPEAALEEIAARPRVTLDAVPSLRVA